MISREQFYGKALQLVGNGPFVLNPDRARFYTIYPTVAGIVRLPSMTQIRHWRPGPDFLTVFNFAPFDLTVQYSDGTTALTVLVTDPEIVVAHLIEKTGTNGVWFFEQAETT